MVCHQAVTKLKLSKFQFSILAKVPNSRINSWKSWFIVNLQRKQQSGTRTELCINNKRPRQQKICEQWIILKLMTSQSFLSSEQQYYIYIHLYILEWLLLEAPHKYVHSSLILGLDWAYCLLSSIMCLPYLSWPIHQLVICPNNSYFTHSPSLNN